MRVLAAVPAMMALAACDPPSAPQSEGRSPPTTCQQGAAANRGIVLDFYRRALQQKDVRGASEAYMTPGFVEHKPDIADGSRENTILFLEGLMKELPQARWEVVRSVSEGNLVAVHARFRPAPEAPEYAIADFFRVENCRIAEHWDVVAGPSEKPVNPNPRF